MCEYRWGHFAASDPGALVPDAWLRLPPGLGPLAAWVRGDSRALTAVERRSQAISALGVLGVGAPRVPLRRRAHVAADLYGFALGRGVDATLAFAAPAVSVADFSGRPVACGGFVVTRPAEHSHWSRAAPALANFPFGFGASCACTPTVTPCLGPAGQRVDTHTHTHTRGAALPREGSVGQGEVGAVLD